MSAFVRAYNAKHAQSPMDTAEAGSLRLRRVSCAGPGSLGDIDLEETIGACIDNLTTNRRAGDGSAQLLVESTCVVTALNRRYTRIFDLWSVFCLSSVIPEKEKQT